jgi:hypothetical protein
MGLIPRVPPKDWTAVVAASGSVDLAQPGQYAAEPVALIVNVAPGTTGTPAGTCWGVTS